MRTLFLLVVLLFLQGCSGSSSNAEPAPKEPAPKDDGPPGEAKPPAPPPDDGDPVPKPAPAVIDRHVLSVALDPATHMLEGTDEIELSGAGATGICFNLNRNFEVVSVAFGRLAAAWTFKDGILDVRFPTPSLARFTVTVAWKGTLHDPPKRDEMRFVTGEKSAGTIQAEGAWLPPSAGWYPEIAGSMARFTVTAKIPEDWEFIGPGGRHDYDAKTRKSTWSNPVKSDGLTCMAGPYVAGETRSGRVTVRSFFLKEDAAIGDQYRERAAEWIEFFSDLLGPYPYDDFSVVENFFSTGYGMPGWTLLGREIVRMGGRYLGESGLGHEILHCWWGNSVFVEGGNWCEALTTYCSNYYWLEKTQGPAAARKYRRHQMVRYTMHVDPAKDYPVAKFTEKVTELDNEIGYAKGSMLFHVVRREIGDDAFWKALRRMVRTFTGRRAAWDDFRAAFEAESGRDLDRLFAQWLETTGTPSLTLEHDGDGLRLSAAGPLTHFRVTVRAHRADGHEDHDLVVADGVADWTEPGDVTRVEVDPDFELFRRLPLASLPRCLNRVLMDDRQAVVLPSGDETPWKELLERLEGWERIPAAEATAERLAGRSVLVLGGPEVNGVAKRWQASGALKLPGVEVLPDGWTAGGETVTPGQNRALLVSLANPDDAVRHATVFLAASAEALKPARLLLYYAWDSWYVWRDGRVAAQGEFAVPAPLEMELK